MKINYNILLSFLLLVGVFSCSEDELDIDALTDFAPGILEITPSDGNKVVKGDFDIVAKFVDGTVSPLAEGTLKLMDNDGNEIASISKSLSGIADSLVLSASDFDAASLELGFYQLSATATDVKGQITSYDGTFEISSLPYAANYEEMYMAGSFNSWGSSEFELTGPNTWTLSEVTLDGGEWKLKNCADWCDQDWADPDGDGIVENTTGGGANSASSPTGLYNVVFNDNNLTITFEPAVTFAQNVTSLYLVGSINDFQGSDEYAFAQVEDNLWILAEVELGAGDILKFSEGPNFDGKNYGDNEVDGVAELYGSPITLADDANSGFYEVVFNDKTLEYQFNFLRFPSIGIIGSATPGGWDADTDMQDNGDGTFSVTLELVDGEAKFRANDAWDVNWGAADFPSGIATAGGANILVTAGTYEITFSPETGEYSFEPATVDIGIIGSATPGSWDADTDMQKNEDGTFSVVLALTDGEAKFRANDAWDDNWGAGDFPSGVATAGGDNIPVTAGIYLVTFNPTSGEYAFTEVSIGIIGSATASGWDADTNLSIVDAANPAVVSATMDLTEGEAKFRANDDWTYNWGAGDFPSGVAEANGTNIPVTAGTYVVTFNLNTGEYSFDLQ
ncbi:SusF/SusE family outer membrane protein [Chondrinema litorale]|uniref:SusF/SusE family outer membrane protein n=1 Tax=Chondrinema litorale TaxID=2994555 RepID=UPI002542B835|nr:SusF/SusE family outer membrane protein [Chondrinema litorale]UZR97983.1 SusF/SusE family outer membrane protein [Chondrinema litorale]